MLQIKYISKFYKDININDNNRKHTDLLYHHTYNCSLEVYSKLKPSEIYIDKFILMILFTIIISTNLNHMSSNRKF